METIWVLLYGACALVVIDKLVNKWLEYDLFKMRLKCETELRSCRIEMGLPEEVEYKADSGKN
jgi:hypothetical protein